MITDGNRHYWGRRGRCSTPPGGRAAKPSAFHQPRQNLRCHRLAILTHFTRWAYARRTAASAPATANQRQRLLQQLVVQLVERLRKADATGVVVVEIEVGLEV